MVAVGRRRRAAGRGKGCHDCLMTWGMVWAGLSCGPVSSAVASNVQAMAVLLHLQQLANGAAVRLSVLPVCLAAELVVLHSQPLGVHSYMLSGRTVRGLQHQLPPTLRLSAGDALGCPGGGKGQEGGCMQLWLQRSTAHLVD
jgi:hypothetical protein